MIPVSGMNDSIGYQLKEKVSALQEAILSKHPKMPILLQEIHKALKAQPENITLLGEEEIGIIVSGLEIQTGYELAASMTKGSGKSSTAAKIKSLGSEAF